MQSSLIKVALMLMLGAAVIASAAQPTSLPAAAVPLIVLKPAVEEGKQVLQALVTLAGKPVPDAKIRFGIRRTFGTLWLGEDTCDPDGIAAIAFPINLPGNERGELEATVTILGPQAWAGIEHAQWITGGRAVAPPSADSFSRALWAPHAPLPLIASILGAVGLVWCSYAFVLTQILAIRKGGRS